MQTLSTSAPLASLGLTKGDHVVKFHVEDDEVTFEITTSSPVEPKRPAGRKKASFIERWGGTGRYIEDPGDPWLTHINEKHLK